MEIIILESLNKLGKAGDVVNVKDGFARNFLIPQKKAIVANKKNKSDLEKKMSEIEKNNQIKVKEAQDVKSKIEGKTIKIEMESNEEGNLYGAVTQKSIVESILGSMSIKLSTDSVILTPIKALGMHEIKIHLYDEVYANINLEIINKS
jgi:large subunit ribosomal protein L9